MRTHNLLLVVFLGMATASAGCGSGEIGTDDDGADDDVDFGFEGDEADECSDGVDNDQDGLTDCDDDGCEAATACSGDDDDNGDDDVGDDDADDDAGDDDAGDDDAGDDDAGDDDTSAVDDLWALDFDSFDDCVIVGDQVEFDQLDQALTIEAWINPVDNDSGCGLTVVSKRFDEPDPPDSGFTLHYWSWDGPGFNADSMRFQVGTDAGFYELYGGANSIQGGTWTYVAAVYDGSEMRIYVDGVLDASQPASGTMLANDDSFDIGCRSDTSNAYKFEGLISQTRIWGRALTEAEIQQQFIQSGSIDPSDLLGRWDIEEGTGNILYDASGHGYDGIIYGGATWIPM